MFTNRCHLAIIASVRLFIVSTFFFLFTQAFLPLSASAQEAELITGQNINMVSGTRWPDGDPFLQRQNEPSIAVSSRNEFNLLAGSNDYRTVDLPGLPDGKTIGDSWVSYYRSNTGGGRWTSTLLPGYPQDTSALGQLSPLWLAGYEASADPVIRSGTHGLFYYSGIAFTRSENPPSAGFVATFVDLNNDERKSSIGYVRTTLFDQNLDGQNFIDKPWMAVDKPRSGAAWVPLNVYLDDEQYVTQEVECGNVYVAYARIQGDGTTAVSSQIMFVRSSDCGATWTAPKQLSLPNTINQGASVAIEPVSGDILVAWRQFANATQSCTQKANYWRVNPNAWPVDQIELANILASKENGGQYVVTVGDEDDVVDTEVYSDTDFSDDADRPSGVFRQLLAAWLNILSGADGDAVTSQLEEAEAWLLENPLGTRPEPAAKRAGNDLRKYLRDFNKGKIGPGSCEAMAGDETNELLSGLNPNAIKVVKSTNAGSTFSLPVDATDAGYLPFEQATTPYSFRTTGYPTMTFDGDGRAYIAYATRGLAIPDNDPIGGDSRIVITTSNNGTNWSTAYAIDESQRPGHQFQPALTFSRGKLFLLHYDMREDIAGVFDRFITDLPVDPTVPRHSTDVRVAVADAADAPVFTDYTVLDVNPSTQTSRYPFMLFSDGTVTINQQMKYNPPNLPMFKGGTAPFFGDYIDIAALQFIKDSSGIWQFDIDPSAGAPVLHAVWTDNRDVVGSPDGDWTSYVPPTYAYDIEGNPLPDPNQRTSFFDAITPVAKCDPNDPDVSESVVDRTKMRNQNIYTSRITQGLAAAIPGNNRPLGTIQRAFASFVQNTTDTDKTFRLEILNQPVGGIASFDQFAETPVTQIDEVVERQSSIARSIYVTSTDPAASINVRVTEIDESGPVLDGLAATMWINADSSAPQPAADNILSEETYTPAIFNPAIFNPAIFNTALLGEEAVGIFSPAIFNNTENDEFFQAALMQQALLNPAIFNPAIFNLGVSNPAIFNPAIFNPAIFNPAIFNPAIFNPAIFNPAIFNPAIFNPAIFNPAIFNPAIFNPAIFNPAIFNPAIFNTTLVETSTVVKNEGNATAAYSVNMDLEDPPEGFLYQLMVFRTYTTPVAEGCELGEQVVQEAIVNELMPNMNGDLYDPNSTSFFVAPGDHVVVTLRIVPDPDAPVPGDPTTIDTLDELQLSQSIVPQAVDTVGLSGGATEPTPVIVFAPGTTPVSTLSEADWLAPGDGLLTVDSATGLEWLDLTFTNFTTLVDVTAQLAPGGQYEGFSYATADQVAELFTNAGLRGFATDWSLDLGSSDAMQTAAARELLGLWGITVPAYYPGPYSWACIGEWGPPPYGSGIRYLSYLSVTPSSWSAGTRRSHNNGCYNISTGMGHALVRVPPIGTLIQADWHKPGDGLLTRDSATGLEWLDLTATTNMSVAEVTANLQKGGQFEGFEYATADQVAELFANVGLQGYSTDGNLITGNTDPLQVAAATALLNLWGITNTTQSPDHKFSNGILDEVVSVPPNWRSYAGLIVEQGARWWGGTKAGAASGDAIENLGHALVRSGTGAPESIGTLSEADWQVPGDNQITIDSATGLQWLNLTMTKNMTIDEVNRELGSTGMFPGFRYATAAEVEQMFANAGLSAFGTEATGTIQGNTDAATRSVAVSLQRILGLTCFSDLPSCTYDTSAGYIGAPSSFGSYYRTILNVDPLGWGAGSTSGPPTDGSAQSYLGSMLVRP